MAQSSIFKPVAIVTFLSAMAVIMIDRRISVDIISDTIRELIPNRSAIAGVNNPAQVTETSRPAVRKKGNPKSGWNVTWAVGEWRTVTELPDKPQSLRLG